MRFAIALGIIGVSFFTLSYFALPELTSFSYVMSSPAESEKAEPQREPEVTDTREVISHVPLPEQVKAIYMTSCVAGTNSFRDKLVSLIDETEVNAVVIDVKDYSGTISFPPAAEEWEPAWASARCGTSDMKDFIRQLHEKGIYVIARITVFQDPFYAPTHPDLAVQRTDGSVWRDGKGLSFIDVGAKGYWDHKPFRATKGCLSYRR